MECAAWSQFCCLLNGLYASTVFINDAPTIGGNGWVNPNLKRDLTGFHEIEQICMHICAGLTGSLNLFYIPSPSLYFCSQLYIFFFLPYVYL